MKNIKLQIIDETIIILSKIQLPSFQKNTYLNYNYRHKKNHNYEIRSCVVSQLLFQEAAW